MRSLALRTEPWEGEATQAPCGTWLRGFVNNAGGSALGGDGCGNLVLQNACAFDGARSKRDGTTFDRDSDREIRRGKYQCF